MTKYILSSGYSVISELPLIEGEQINYSISNIAEKAVQFNTIGEAMAVAAKINKILNGNSYRAMPIEI